MNDELGVNLADVSARIIAACARARRVPSDVTLVGVTKTRPARTVLDAYDAGISDVGENYVQELVEKAGTVSAPVRWHFIGHLQRNKVRQISGFVHLIHGVDSQRLGAEIDRQAAACGRRIPVLLQVNTSGEESKFGVEPKEAVDLARELLALPNIELRGLMTLAAFLDDAEATRPMFRLLRVTRDDVEKRLDVRLPELSMGMTADYHVAIEEGATMVRVGTALFGARGQET